MNNNQRFVAELVGLLSVGGAIWVKAAPPKHLVSAVLQTRRLEVVGKKGKAQAIISVDENEMPSIRLLDKQGKERVQLELSPKGFPRLSLMDAGSGASVALDVRDTDANLYIFGRASNISEGVFHRGIALSVDKSNEANLHFFDSLTSRFAHFSSSESHLSLGVSKQAYYLSMSGKQTQSHFTVSVPSKGQATSEIYDVNNKRVWVAPPKPDE